MGSSPDIDLGRYLATGIDVCQYESVPRDSLTRTQTPAPCCAPLLGGVLSPAEAEELAGALKVLADPARLRLLSLVAAQADGVCACDLVEPLARSQPTVSHHLKVLREAGLVESEKRGPWVWYRAVPERLDALRAALV
jgi:ArsR family transcriptional regulator, arsenate/arsenite/antimonite-responsive transcriptional repressor